MQQDKPDLPNLIGTSFVKKLRDYIIKSVTETEMNEQTLVTQAYMEMSIKPDTTRKYINEMILMGVLEKDENEILKSTL